MNHLMHDPAREPRPGWVELAGPGWQHRAAHAAWRHEPSGYVLLKFWVPDEPEGLVGRGTWEYELRGPGYHASGHGGGQRRVAVVTHEGDPRPVGRLLELAEAAIRVMEAEPSGNSGGPGG